MEGNHNPDPNNPTALPLVLDLVRGPERLPAEEYLQEVLRGKLRTLQVDSTEVTSVFTELSSHISSINSEEKVIFVKFKSFEEIWKFHTYYTVGFLGPCLESLLLDDKLWLRSLDDHYEIDVSVPDETLNVIYRRILLHEGSLFAHCSSNQMFDSCTSSRDLYLEQGALAQFEPPFLGSGWTIRCLYDGSRGTAPKPALDPVIPFHQWFLKSCPESILVGEGKPASDVPVHCARGTCLVTEEWNSEGPDELNVAPGDSIIIVGFLVSSFHWFMGRKEETGEVGLVRTSLVQLSTEFSSSADVFLDEEETMFFRWTEDKVIEETLSLIRKKSHIDAGEKYKLDIIESQELDQKPSAAHQTDLKRNIQRIIDQGLDASSDLRVRTGYPEPSVLPEGAEDTNSPSFTVNPPVEENNSPENFTPLFSFLEGPDYKVGFNVLYRLRSEILKSSLFCGHSDEDELMAFLSVARETARKKRLLWPQTRLCFLLGKLCALRSKFSQARVYFEEALSVPKESFQDVQLLTSIYSSLASAYQVQKKTERFFAVMERLVALLLGIPDCLECLEDDLVLKYILKRALFCENRPAEARACYLLARHHWTCADRVSAIPYLERLLGLAAEAEKPWTFSLSHGYLTLAQVYSDLCLPHLSISSSRKAFQQPSAKLSDCLKSTVLALNNFNKLCGITDRESSIQPKVAPFLHQALTMTRVQQETEDQYQVLSLQLTVCLCQLLSKHGMVERAIHYLHLLFRSSPREHQVPISVPDRNAALIWLAWLHINQNQPGFALEILDIILSSLPEHCTVPQEGVVHNMRGVALGYLNEHQGAAESYLAAVDICQEYDDLANWAVAQANLGLLCLKGGANALAEEHLTKAVELFSELDEEGQEENFISVLLRLGRHYVTQQQMDYGKGCYEWALLLAINANLLDSQLSATRTLCHLYEFESPDRAQCILYHQHYAQLLTRARDRKQEGQALESIGQLYLSLGTGRANQAALGYTKSSLGIFIDLGLREKEAYAWLQAGRIYHLLGQTELVDLYVQVAQDVALRTGNTGFILKFLEDAGDTFFNSCKDRDKAITFYRDRALPMAAKNSSVHTRLRLCNKLAEVMYGLKLYGEAVEFAQMAVDISITEGDQLTKRVACHRLASLYRCLDQYELAEHYYLKTLSHCPTPLQFDEETLYYVQVYRTLGDITFYDLKDPHDAAGYYHLALAAAMDLGNKRAQLQLCTRLATIYHNFLTDRELSLFFYQRARRFAAKLNVKRIDISADKFGNRYSLYKTMRAELTN